MYNWTLEDMIESVPEDQLRREGKVAVNMDSFAKFRETFVDFNKFMFTESNASVNGIYYVLNDDDENCFCSRIFTNQDEENEDLRKDYCQIFRDIRMGALLELFIQKYDVKYFAWHIPLCVVEGVDKTRDMIAVEYSIDVSQLDDENCDSKIEYSLLVVRYIFNKKTGKLLDSINLQPEEFRPLLDELDFKTSYAHLIELARTKDKDIDKVQTKIDELSSQYEEVERRSEGYYFRVNPDVLCFSEDEFDEFGPWALEMIMTRATAKEGTNTQLFLLQDVGDVCLYYQGKEQMGTLFQYEFPTFNRKHIQHLIKKHGAVGIAWNHFLGIKKDEDDPDSATMFLICGFEMKSGGSGICIFEGITDKHGRILDFKSVDKESSRDLLNTFGSYLGHLKHIFNEEEDNSM